MLAVTIGTQLHAQSVHRDKCMTDQHYENYLENNPQARQQLEQAARIWETNRNNPVLSKKGQVYTIPVVFHVIHEYGPENISKAQIEDQIRILNEDFRRLNTDASNTRAIFQGVAADAEVEFVLASKDPQGNCTEGIVRVYSPLTNDARDNVKSVSYWPSDQYLNVWVVKTIKNSVDDPGVITLGYAQFPWDRPSRPTTDGIVLRADYTGSIGTAAGKGNNGRTATHEIGHWLGLFHTFQGGCSNVSWGEQFDDTPPVAEPTSGCPANANTCSNDNPDLIDQWENYMDYSNGSCQNMFTQEQAAYMHLMIQSYRTKLVSASNATATGINSGAGNCAPVADLTNIISPVCQGNTVTFTDLSYNGTISSRTWTFEGGTPSTSSDPNPTVTYSSAGVFQVKLEVSNGTGNSAIIRDSLIYVVPAISDVAAPIIQDFEGNDFPPAGWKLSTTGNVNWAKINGAGTNGNSSIRAINNSNTTDGSSIQIQLPPLDLQVINDPVLTFDLAYARLTGTSLDRIRVFASTDCGVSWVLIYQRAGVQMETGATGTSNFVPSSGEWDNHQVMLNNYVGKRNVILRFDAISNQGGNIYLDNINIGSVSSVEHVALNSELSLYPNPSSGQVQLQFTAFEAGEASIEVLDLSGKVVHRAAANVFSGENNNTLNLSGLSEGMYLVQVEMNGQRITQKLMLRY